MQGPTLKLQKLFMKLCHIFQENYVYYAKVEAAKLCKIMPNLPCNYNKTAENYVLSQEKNCTLLYNSLWLLCICCALVYALYGHALYGHACVLCEWL